MVPVGFLSYVKDFEFFEKKYFLSKFPCEEFSINLKLIIVGS